MADVKAFLSRATDAPAFPAALEWMLTDSARSAAVPHRNGLDLAARDTVAFLQYTSGSTSLPKGVVLTHGNLAHNLTLIITALSADTTCRVVSWLPQYHDMGLIGSLLGSMYCGGSAWVMSPLSFVKNPPVWLIAASRFKATHLQAPNFAYRLTVRKFKAMKEPPAALDLASVQHVFNAAEPIDPDAMDLFVATFAPFKFKREALVPGYGLAEHTVYVCDGGKQRLRLERDALERENKVVIAPAEASNAHVLVGCGVPPPSVALFIVNPDTGVALKEDEVGEIWISSPSKASAYFGLEEKTARDLKAKLAVDPGTTDAAAEDPREFLRTGDMGFLHERELFVCGRIKDMLIVRGRNLFPQDVEHSVEKVRGMRAGCSACFVVHVEGEGEVVCVVAEVREGEEAHAADLLQKAKQAVAKEHGVALHAMVLIKAHTMLKTTSGKVSRYRAKDAFLERKLDVIKEWQAQPGEDVDAGVDGADAEEDEAAAAARFQAMSPDEVLARFADEAAAMLEVQEVDVDVPLVELGFDSMMLAQFKGGLKNSLGCELEDAKLFNEEATLRILVHDVCGLPPPAAPAAPAPSGDVDGDAATKQESSISVCCRRCCR